MVVLRARAQMSYLGTDGQRRERHRSRARFHALISVADDSEDSMRARCAHRVAVLLLLLLSVRLVGRLPVALRCGETEAGPGRRLEERETAQHVLPITAQ